MKVGGDMLIAILEDKIFKKSVCYDYKRRWTVRAFAYNDNNQIAMLKIRGHDVLGRRDCYETIGGGVQNDETLEEALKREVLEETGYDCEIKKHIGYIVDHYNAFCRETISNFFIVKLTNKIDEPHLTKQEEGLISGLEFIPEAEFLNKITDVEKGTVNELIARRDAVAFKYYKKYSLE